MYGDSLVVFKPIGTSRRTERVEKKSSCIMLKLLAWLFSEELPLESQTAV